MLTVLCKEHSNAAILLFFEQQSYAVLQIRHLYWLYLSYPNHHIRLSIIYNQ